MIAFEAGVVDIVVDIEVVVGVCAVTAVYTEVVGIEGVVGVEAD